MVVHGVVVITIGGRMRTGYDCRSGNVMKTIIHETMINDYSSCINKDVLLISLRI